MPRMQDFAWPKQTWLQHWRKSYMYVLAGHFPIILSMTDGILGICDIPVLYRASRT